jgi:rhodanese-related sulfurtransferase/mannose-6-phosphate isomerase-like protein (cupin superfamily)
MRADERPLWRVFMHLEVQKQTSTEVSNAVFSLGLVSKSPEELARIVADFASSSDGWIDRVRLRTDGRWYERMYQGPDHDIWLISWMPGQSTGFHDHGESAGAFLVATGALEEHRPGEQPIVILPGQTRVFESDYAHDVRNVSSGPAVSIHAYSPPLSEMNEYEWDGGQLVPRENASERADALDRARRVDSDKLAKPAGVLSIGQVLSAARARLQRLLPEQVYEQVTEAGAVLIDIRPESQRANEGSIPGALIVERNVLEWRFDPTSNVRLPLVTDYDLQVIVLCSEGYTSSLAAASLQDLGLWRATDLVGGFHAWRAAGLPITPPKQESGLAIVNPKAAS